MKIGSSSQANRQWPRLTIEDKTNCIFVGPSGVIRWLESSQQHTEVGRSRAIAHGAFLVARRLRTARDALAAIVSELKTPFPEGRGLRWRGGLYCRSISKYVEQNPQNALALIRYSSAQH